MHLHLLEAVCKSILTASTVQVPKAQKSAFWHRTQPVGAVDEWGFTEHLSPAFKDPIFCVIVTPRGVRQEINQSAERCTTEQMCYLCSSCWFGIWNQSPHWSSKILPRLEQSHCLGDVRTWWFCMDRAGLLIAELRVSLGLSTANSGVATLVCLVNWFAPVTALQETIVLCFDCKENKHHSCGKRKWSGCSKNRDSSGAKEKQKEPSYRDICLVSKRLWQQPGS